MRFFILLAAQAGIVVAQTPLPQTYSGPSYRHLIQVLRQSPECTTRINGQLLSGQGTIEIQTPDATVTVQTNCSFPGPSTTQWSGTIALSGPPDMPVSTRTANQYRMPAGTFRTGASAALTFTPSVSRSATSTYDAKVEMRQGIEQPGANPRPNGSPSATCDYRKTEQTRQPKAAISLSAQIACDNQAVTGRAVSPAHGFGTPSNNAAAEIVTNVRAEAAETSQFGTGPGGIVEFIAYTQYKVSGAVMTITPATLRVNAGLGQATATGSLEITNTGGGNLDWTATSPTGNLTYTQGGGTAGFVTYRLSPTRSTGIGPRQSGRLTVNLDTSTARSIGTFAISRINLGSDQLTGGQFALEAVIGDTASNEISLTGIAPAAGTEMPAQSPQRISANAVYALNTAVDGTVQLEVADQSGAVIARSTGATVNRGGAPVPLTVSFTVPATATRLVLKATLAAGGQTIDSAVYAYPVGSAVSCPGGNVPMRAGGRQGANCEAISITLTVPAADQPLLALSATLPPICASGAYTIGGLTGGFVVLELFDEGGKVLAQSKEKSLDPATGGVWGGGCTNPRDLVFIPDQPMPLFDVPEGAAFDKPVGELWIRASLYYNGVDFLGAAPAAVSDRVFYKVMPGAKFRLNSLYTEKGEEISLNPENILFSGDYFQHEIVRASGLEGRLESADFDLEYAGPPANLVIGAEVILPHHERKLIFGSVTKVTPGQTSGRFALRSWPTLSIPGDALQVVLRTRLHFKSGVAVEFDSITWPVETLVIDSAAPSGNCVLGYPGMLPCPQTGGEDNSLQFGLTVMSRRPDQQIMRTIHTIATFPTNDRRVFLPDILVPGVPLGIEDRFNSGPIPVGAKGLSVSYKLGVPDSTFSIGNGVSGFPLRAGDSYEFFELRGPTKAVVAGAGNSPYAFPGGSLDDIRATRARDLTVSGSGTNIASYTAPGGGGLDKWLRAAAAANPAFLAIARTWIFPDIPRDGSFGARLTLEYSAEDLPTHPNFAESRLQVISVDANGAFRVYPTILNLNNKSASAVVDGLDPYYSLAVVGPFAYSDVWLANAGAGSVLVNTSAQTANVTLNGSPVAIAPGALRLGGAEPGLIQATTDVQSLDGVSWTAAPFAVTPSSSPGQLLVFPSVEYSARRSTVISIANASPFANQVRITLLKPDGSRHGVHDIALDPKAAQAAALEGMFAGLPKGFAGYAVIASSQALAASGVLSTPSAATGLVAQPMTPAHLTISTRHAVQPNPQPGAAAATLHLVNLGTGAATVTIRARDSAGIITGTSTQQLAAGQQFTRDLGDLFPGAGVASVETTSSAPGVVGDLLTVDGAFTPNYLASLPLVSDPRTASVLPYTGAESIVFVYNPNAAAASVSVVAFDPAGVRGGTAAQSVPAYGSARIAVGAVPGYLQVLSSQPVTSGALVKSGSSEWTGYPSLPATPATAPPPVAPAPRIAATPSALAFGDSPLNAPKDLPVQVSNTGQAALNVTAEVSGTGFTLVSARTFTINAGAASQAVTVRFQPTSASAATGTLRLTSNDPAQPTVLVPISGTGAQSTGGGETGAGCPSTANVARNGISSQISTIGNNVASLGNNGVIDEPNGFGFHTDQANAPWWQVDFGTTKTICEVRMYNRPSADFGRRADNIRVLISSNGADFETVYTHNGTAWGTAASSPPLTVPVSSRQARYLRVQVPEQGTYLHLREVEAYGSDASSGGGGGSGGGSTGAPALQFSLNGIDAGGRVNLFSVPVRTVSAATLTVRNSGTAAAVVTSITSNNPVFSGDPQSFTLAPGATTTVNIRFAPVAEGAQSGALTFNMSGGLVAALAVSGTGTPNAGGGGGGGGGSTTDPNVLKLDDGGFELTTGFNQGGVQGYFVNRLIPTSYPATLRKAILTFPPSGGNTRGLPLGSAVQIVSAVTTASGDPLTGLTLTRTAATVTAFDTFLEFDVPALTIASGSFVVGFTVLNPVGVFPAFFDDSQTTARRAYISSDGATFILVDSIPALGPGVFGIRARVEYGSGTTSPPATSTRIPAAAAAGWPNGRTSNQLPALAIDGNTATYTWTTESFNSASPSYLGIGFAAAASVNRIRLFKDNDAGGPGNIAKNLVIEYTTSATSVPLASRTWTPVSGLANGFNGAELLTAAAVNANGTVSADNHNSLATGFASLTFNAVNATGIRIGFSNATPISVNHYRVYEFEAHGTPAN